MMGKPSETNAKATAFFVNCRREEGDELAMMMYSEVIRFRTSR
jgi:hypothetical protein